MITEAPALADSSSASNAAMDIGIDTPTANESETASNNSVRQAFHIKDVSLSNKYSRVIHSMSLINIITLNKWLISALLFYNYKP